MGTPSPTMTPSTILLLATATSASVVPIKFDFGALSPSLSAVKQCAGHEDDSMVVVEGTTPDSICMPGVMTMDMHTLIREDLPTDLLLKKLTPFPMKVPCMNGIGSCEYEICPMIEAGVDTWCPSFPETQPCSCPLKAGHIVLKGIEIPVQDMGPILGPLMDGAYSATATFYGASAKDKILGCVEFTFSLKANC